MADSGQQDAKSPVAALFVDPNGVYANLPGVEVWDEARDARRYAGPWPVVAHPPCARWSNLAHIHKHRWPIGDDGGCFDAALNAVRTYGGVLEHPAYSLAWRQFGLLRPSTDSWSSRRRWDTSLFDDGWVTEVSQSAYGHRARKRTWLYYVGPEPPALDWSDPQGYPLENMNTHGGEASRTPPAFRDMLLAMARSASVRTAA